MRDNRMPDMRHGAVLLATIICLLAGGCHGDDRPASQLMLFKELPPGADLTQPQHLNIRSNFQGSVEFIELDKFHIEVNITAPSSDDLSKVHYNYTMLGGSVLLQMFETDPEKTPPIMWLVAAVVAVAGLIGFIISTVTVIWWSMVKKPNLATSETVINQDSSQAPLLESNTDAGTSLTEEAPKVKKKRHRVRSKQQTGEASYPSSEDDAHQARINATPSRIYGAKPVPRPVENIRHTDAPLASSDPMMSDSTNRTSRSNDFDAPPPPPMPPEKPVVSYINLQSVDSVDARFNRRKAKACPGVNINASNGDASDVDKVKLRGDYTSIPTGENMPDIVSRQNGTIDGDMSSCFPPPPPPLTSRGLHDDRELDSVGSSRSGDSSRSSVNRMPGSCSDSTLRSDADRNALPDSDSSRSVSGGPWTKDVTLKRRGVTDVNGRTDGQRIVGDEAYGTMMSNGSNTTMHSSLSAGSAGSGSSGSVVTVIAADGDHAGQRIYTKLADTRCGFDDGNRVTPGVERRAQRTERGVAGGKGCLTSHHYLHATVLCCVAIVCLSSGVVTRSPRETEVHIRVFAPPHFLHSEPHVYLNRHKPVTVETRFSEQSLDVQWYDVDDAWVRNPEMDKCRRNSCSQGCDINSGQCICLHGFTLKNQYLCEDIDECRTTSTLCHEYAQCHNVPGSYKCVCLEGYHGDGTDCKGCNRPCRDGTYEVMPCSDTHPKLCRECSTTCMDEHYISAPCNAMHDSQCEGCSPACEKGHYEATPCFKNQNRQCKRVSGLPKPTVSRNVLYEDLSLVVSDTSEILQQEKSSQPLTRQMTLDRGSGFVVQVNLIESNLAPLYEAVDHSESNDNDAFYSDRRVLQEFCPYPVPEKYLLSSILHKGVTTKALFNSCATRLRHSDTSPFCDGATGYDLDPTTACFTYSQFGRMAKLSAVGASVVCTRPGRLTDVFDLSDQLDNLSTMFIDKTVKCAERRTNCESCTVACARNMENHRGGHRCNITGDDPDNGQSPRLRYCYSCCNKRECDKLCEVYHDPECQQIRCVTGNLSEFILTPQFSDDGTVFGCHVAPARDYTVYRLQYTVLHDSKPISDRWMTAEKTADLQRPDKAIGHHDFLKVYYGSKVSAEPDLVQGDAASHVFTAGHYKASGVALELTDVPTSSVIVQPRRPFTVSSKLWKSQGCDSAPVSDLINADAGDLYRPNSQLHVEYVRRGRYRMFNNSDAHLPFIWVEIPADHSVLRPFYNETTVKDDASLKVELSRGRKQWLLTLKAEMNTCPGAFTVRVLQPGHNNEPLFNFDVLANCPAEFTFSFSLPTEGADNHDKRFNIEIVDSFRTIKVKLFRPAPKVTAKEEATRVRLDDIKEDTVTIFTPFVVAICTSIAILGLFLVVGFIREPGHQVKSSDNSVQSRHLVFVVTLVTFRTAYSIAVTFTVLLLLVPYSNRDSTSQLAEFPRYSSTAENAKQLQIGHIRSYVLEELRRQNDLANQTKTRCEVEMGKFQALLEESKQRLKVESSQDKLVSQMALQYTRLMVVNLTKNVNKFKKEFSTYAQKSLDKLTRSFVETSSALESNKWLAGAKVIYNVVKSKRSAKRKATKSFLDWVGIRHDVDRLAVDLSIKDFPVPNLTEFMKLNLPEANSESPKVPRSKNVALPRNHWYYEFEKPSTEGATESRKSPSSKGGRSAGMSWSMVLLTLVVIDLVWFVHRMACTYSTAKMILYGCPSFVDCKKSAGSTPQGDPKTSSSSRCLKFCKELNLRVMQTEFVPKLVATATVCCLVAVVMSAADNLLTVKALSAVGYFESLVAPVETTDRLARTHIDANAYRINRFEYPFYEQLTNMRVKRSQLLLQMYTSMQHDSARMHAAETCAWQRLLDPSVACNCTTAPQVLPLVFDGCELAPVVPRQHERKDFGVYRNELMLSILPYLNSGRHVVMDTCQLGIVFVGVLVLVDVLGTVLWIYLKRFGMLRLRQLYEIEQPPVAETNHM